MKFEICTAAGLVGGFFAAAFGGWSEAMTTLVIMMIIDYILGIAVAGFKRSPKTENGGLESKAGFIGLCRKGVVLLIVLVAARLDITLGVTYIRDAAVIGFIANELISIVENVGLLGVPLPAVITNVIEILNKKSEEEE